MAPRVRKLGTMRESDSEKSGDDQPGLIPNLQTTQETTFPALDMAAEGWHP